MVAFSRTKTDRLLSEARNTPPVPNGIAFTVNKPIAIAERLVYLKRDSVKSAAVILTRGVDTPEGKLGVVGVAMPDAVVESSAMKRTLCRCSYVMRGNVNVQRVSEFKCHSDDAEQPYLRQFGD